MISDNLYIYGDAAKASSDGIIKGYAIRFGAPGDADLEGDYFSATETDFGRPMKMGDKFKINLYYHHGADATLKSYPIGYGEMTMDDVGMWYEAQIDMSNEYGKMIDKLAKEGKLGFSTGATGHLVARERKGKNYLIKTWCIGEVSCTPTPAESRNKVYKLIDIKAKVGDIKVGDYVSWMSSGGESRGRVENISTSGALSSEPVGPDMTGTEDNPAYKIRIYQEMDGSFEPSDVRVVHRADALTKIDKPKFYWENKNMNGYEMEDNSEEVEDMVEGLVELGVSPQDMAMTIFEDANADLASEAVHKLFYMMCEGLDAVLEGGYNIEYVNVLIDEFAMRSKDVVNKLYDNPDAEMAYMKLLTKGPTTNRELERCLRDVLHFSNSQSKALAGKMADFFRDQEVAAKQTEEHIANDSEVKNLLIKKMMLDLMRD